MINLNPNILKYKKIIFILNLFKSLKTKIKENKLNLFFLFIKLI